MVHNGMVLPSGDIWQSPETVWLAQLEENIDYLKSRDVANILKNTALSPSQTKNYLALSVTSAILEEPCPWIFRPPVTWGHLSEDFSVVWAVACVPGELIEAFNLIGRQSGVEGAQTWV